MESVEKGKPGSLPLLIDKKLLTSVNSTTVGQAIVQTVVDYGIRYEDLWFVMCDNACYMTKCIRKVLKPLFHMLSNETCWTHIPSLVSSRWVDVFANVNSFVADMKNILFTHQLARVDINLFC